MQVSTYLELYLSVFGWLMYDNVWQLLSDTGLAFVPFLGMLFKNIFQPMYRQPFAEASATSLRLIELDTISMMTVVVLAVQPVFTVNLSGMSYTKACSGKAAVSPGATGTTYDTVFTETTLGGNTAKIPAWWYGVLALSGGLNDGLIATIPCTNDIRVMAYQVQNSRIKDPQVRNQVQLFYNDCYSYGMSRFLDTKTPYPNTLPIDDLYWLGSAFLKSNYYDQRRASENIPGFPYSASRDLEYDPAIEIPAYGKPTCNEWWTGTNASSANAGLRQALINQVETTFLTDLETKVAAMSGKTAQEVDDIAIKTLIAREQQYFNGLSNLQQYNDRNLDTANSAAGTLGSLMESISFYPKMYMVKTAAPIVQAIVLMLIYMLLVFILVLSSYSIESMITMSVILFSVKFWTVLWAVAHWLDNHLIEALEPEAWYQWNMSNNLLAEMIINFVTGSLYIALPLVWSGMLGWAGVAVGKELSNFASDISEHPYKAGEKGGGMAKKMASNMTTKSFK